MLAAKCQDKRSAKTESLRGHAAKRRSLISPKKFEKKKEKRESSPSQLGAGNTAEFAEVPHKSASPTTRGYEGVPNELRELSNMRKPEMKGHCYLEARGDGRRVH